MSDLTIGRLTATVGPWPDSERDGVPTMLRHVADTRLQDAVRAHGLPAGEWCVRRVDVDVRLDPDRPPSALEAEWADQIVIALRRSLRDGSQDVVRYERREDAVDDLLVGLATGHHDRAWAWRQVGVLASDDPDPGTASQELALRVLQRLPHGGVAAALTRLVARTGVPAVHRLLGSRGWTTAAGLALRGIVEADWLGAPVDPAADVAGSRAAREKDAVVDDGLSKRADALVSTSALAAALGGSGLRPDAPALRAWAVLVLAAADPAALRTHDAKGLVRALADRLRPAAGAGLAAARTVPPARGGPALREPPTTGVPRADRADRADGADRILLEADGTDPMATGSPAPATAGDRTAWGGLLFLLNTAAEAGLPESLDEEPLRGRPTPWLVQQLCVRLVPALPDDPAVVALSGVDPDGPGEHAPADDAEAAALDRCAARWASATASRLVPEAPADRILDASDIVHRLARRHAVVVHEPGWVEVVLALDDVDVDVRRAGLDLDPGWVWWLGRVVRFLYD